MEIETLLLLRNYIDCVRVSTKLDSCGYKAHIITIKFIHGESFERIYPFRATDKYKKDIIKLRNAVKKGKNFRKKLEEKSNLII